MKKLYILILIFISLSTHAGSRLTMTSGAIQAEGSGGGGIVPWAVMPGYTSSDELGGSIGFSHVSVNEFDLTVYGAAVGLYDRLELSYARQKLEVKPLNLEIEQDIFGAKVRLFGDAVYRALPQTSLGMQYKYLKDDNVAKALGANSEKGIDFYLAATKVYLDVVMGRNLLINGTLRLTEANQLGLLGFGDKGQNNYKLVGEASIGLLVNHNLIIGLEYRQKPDHLDAVEEDDWMDIYVGWFPSKHFSILAAYANLGDIAGFKEQDGLFLSMQLTL